MYDRVLVITINSYYLKVPSTGTAVILRSTVTHHPCNIQLCSYNIDDLCPADSQSSYNSGANPETFFSWMTHRMFHLIKLGLICQRTLTAYM